MKTIKCEVCNEEVLLDGSFTCTCHNCGANYNTFGQRLANTSQWGYETGELITDIYNDQEDW
ncbi:hypothetical protein [Calidifontibacillus erzurumensis]|uniref:hypothetical protein n=1 Tax=Calidifontibacillus erzurumensis TaxID=2741433 RepID=UPI0035B569A1